MAEPTLTMRPTASTGTPQPRPPLLPPSQLPTNGQQLIQLHQAFGGLDTIDPASLPPEGRALHAQLLQMRGTLGSMPAVAAAARGAKSGQVPQLTENNFHSPSVAPSLLQGGGQGLAAGLGLPDNPLSGESWKAAAKDSVISGAQDIALPGLSNVINMGRSALAVPETYRQNVQQGYSKPVSAIRTATGMIPILGKPLNNITAAQDRIDSGMPVTAQDNTDIVSGATQAGTLAALPKAAKTTGKLASRARGIATVRFPQRIYGMAIGAPIDAASELMARETGIKPTPGDQPRFAVENFGKNVIKDWNAAGAEYKRVLDADKVIHPTNLVDASPVIQKAYSNWAENAATYGPATVDIETQLNSIVKQQERQLRSAADHAGLKNWNPGDPIPMHPTDLQDFSAKIRNGTPGGFNKMNPAGQQMVMDLHKILQDAVPGAKAAAESYHQMTAAKESAAETMPHIQTQGIMPPMTQTFKGALIHRVSGGLVPVARALNRMAPEKWDFAKQRQMSGRTTQLPSALRAGSLAKPANAPPTAAPVTATAAPTVPTATTSKVRTAQGSKAGGNSGLSPETEATLSTPQSSEKQTLTTRQITRAAVELKAQTAAAKAAGVVEPLPNLTAERANAVNDQARRTIEKQQERSGVRPPKAPKADVAKVAAKGVIAEARTVEAAPPKPARKTRTKKGEAIADTQPVPAETVPAKAPVNVAAAKTSKASAKPQSAPAEPVRTTAAGVKIKDLYTPRTPGVAEPGQRIVMPEGMVVRQATGPIADVSRGGIPYDPKRQPEMMMHGKGPGRGDARAVPSTESVPQTLYHASDIVEGERPVGVKVTSEPNPEYVKIADERYGKKVRRPPTSESGVPLNRAAVPSTDKPDIPRRGAKPVEPVIPPPKNITVRSMNEAERAGQKSAIELVDRPLAVKTAVADTDSKVGALKPGKAKKVTTAAKAAEKPAPVDGKEAFQRAIAARRAEAAAAKKALAATELSDTSLMQDAKKSKRALKKPGTPQEVAPIPAAGPELSGIEMLREAQKSAKEVLAREARAARKKAEAVTPVESPKVASSLDHLGIDKSTPAREGPVQRMMDAREQPTAITRAATREASKARTATKLEKMRADVAVAKVAKAEPSTSAAVPPKKGSRRTTAAKAAAPSPLDHLAPEKRTATSTVETSIPKADGSTVHIVTDANTPSGRTVAHEKPAASPYRLKDIVTGHDKLEQPHTGKVVGTGISKSAGPYVTIEDSSGKTHYLANTTITEHTGVDAGVRADEMK